VNEKLWDEEQATYLDFDLVSGQTIRVYAAAGFLPLYAGIPDERCARRMLDGLRNSGFWFEDVFPVPSYDRYGFGFSPSRYWRGPVWVNINWLLMRGLERYGFEKEAECLRSTIVELVRRAGFFEYFDPLTGEGHGSDSFSWTAALLLDVMSDGR
jgi:neutral trehalase